MASTSKTFKTGGDDLDDGLELDPELLAPSDSEEEEGDGAILDDEDQVEEDEDESEGEVGVAAKVAGQKRKAPSEHVEDDSEEGKKAEKKRRKKEKEKERKARRMAEDPTNVSSAILPATHFSPQQISEILLASIRETFPAATSMEIDEIVLPEDKLLLPPDSPAPSALADPFYPLCERLRPILKSLQSKKPPVSTPRVIILSLSGMRCADVVRVVKPQKGMGEVAKLFAKHFKLEEQVKYLAKTRVSIAVGTPARVGKLLSEGAIKITKDTVILLDITYHDPKKRSLLTLPEIRAELWKSVFGGSAREKILEGNARIGAF